MDEWQGGQTPLGRTIYRLLGVFRLVAAQNRALNDRALEEGLSVREVVICEGGIVLVMEGGSTEKDASNTGHGDVRPHIHNFQCI